MAPKPAAHNKSTTDDSQTTAKKKAKDTGPAISWTKDSSRTERLIGWLEQNVVERQKLFSDSSQDAKKEGRKQRVANGAKSKYHLLIATAVFSVDADAKFREDFEANPNKYVKAIENRLAILKSKYRTFNNELGQTGAGLKKEDVVLGSDISNKIDELEKDFPFWSRLHGFWRTLPNINPYTVSSEPGQDLAAEAIRHMAGEGLRDDNTAGSEAGEVIDIEDDDAPAEPVHASLEDDKHAWQFEVHSDSDGSAKLSNSYYDDQPASDPPRSQISQSRQSSYSKVPTSSKAPSVYLKKESTSASGSTRVSKSSKSKRTLIDAFREENETRDKQMVKLASKKIDYKTAELAVKKQKLEVESHRDMEKDRQAIEERMLQQKERMQDKEHVRQKQAEEHQERVLQLQIQLAQANNRNLMNGPPNFANQLPNTFNDAGGFNMTLPQNNYEGGFQ